MNICKSDKSLVRFDRNKIIQTVMSAGADLKLAQQLASDVKAEGYEGMTTDEIRMRVYKRLKRVDVDFAQRYVYRSNMKVRTSAGTLEYFNNQQIIDSLVTETMVNRSFAQEIAKDVEKELGRLRLQYVTSPLIREIVNVKLLNAGMESVRARYTRCGMPVYDVKNLLEHGSSKIAQYSPEAVHKIMSDQIAKEYALLNVLPFDLSDAHMSGQIHIHDLNYFMLRPANFSHDLRVFLRKGLKVDGTGEYTAISSAAKRPAAAFMHAVKVLVAGATECSSDQLIEDFNFILAPYVSGLEYQKVKQLVQMFLYEVSQTSVGKGGQAINSAITISPNLPKHLREMSAINPGGKIIKGLTYSDYLDEAQMIFDAFCDVSLRGDSIGKPFIFPKLIINIPDKRADTDGLSNVSRLATKFGTPYFRLSNTPFYGLRRGTIQHVTINLPQISYSKKTELFEALENRLKKAFEVLLLKKRLMSKSLDANLLPFMKQKAAGLRYYNPKKQQYVISYVGLNELCKAETGFNIEESQGFRFGQKILKAMMKTVNGFSEESGLDFILTGDPKSTPYTSFAQLDSVKFKDKAIYQGGKNPYYSKGHSVNLKSLKDKISIEGKFNNIVSGRTKTHIRIPPIEENSEQMLKFITDILKKDGIKYLSISRTLKLCSKCGYTDHVKMSKCNQCNSRKISLWSKDTSHLENIKTWSQGQRQAYIDELRYVFGGDGEKLPPKKAKIILKA